MNVFPKLYYLNVQTAVNLCFALSCKTALPIEYYNTTDPLFLFKLLSGGDSQIGEIEGQPITAKSREGLPRVRLLGPTSSFIGYEPKDESK